jgi:drug/metabolite transporter (DMT)-like permease
MPIEAIALVLLAAGFHAGWNLLLHDTPDREAAMAVAGVASGLVLLPAMVIWPPWSVWPLVLLSGTAEAIYALGLAAAYRRGMLAVTYPVARGTAPLLVTIGGWLVLSERPGPSALAGAILLGTGLVLLAHIGTKAAQGAAIAFAVFTGTAIASYSLIDARAVREVAPVGYLGAVFLLQGVLLVAWIRLTRHQADSNIRYSCPCDPLRAALKPGLLIGAGSSIAYFLVVLALQRADAGRVATLREISILLGLALAGRSFDRRAWIGATCVVAGVMLAAL